MSDLDIRTPGEDDREPIARCTSRALNLSRDRAIARAHRLPLPDMRVAFDGDRAVATAGEFHFDEWFGGRPLACSGIFAVTTLPEYRGRGLATRLVGDLLDEARERGDPITALYPAVLGPYRSLGYELAGTYLRYRVPVDVLPVDVETPGPEDVDVERDIEGIEACYRAWVRHENGPIEPRRDWWTDRVFDLEEKEHAVVVRAGDRVEGFAAFRREDDPGTFDIAFGLSTSPLVAVTPRALRGLLGYFHGHRGLGRWLEWSGPPNDLIAMLVPEQHVRVHRRWDWMLRILDVEAAFSGRGYPPIEAQATFGVFDPRYEANSGTFQLEVSGGRGAIARAPNAADTQPIPIGTVSAMFTGHLRVRDAVRLGSLRHDDPVVPSLAAMLDGPAPWNPFWF